MMVIVRSKVGLFLAMLCALMLVVGACGDDEATGTGTPDTGGDPTDDTTAEDPTDDTAVDDVAVDDTAIEDTAPDEAVEDDVVVQDPAFDPVEDLFEDFTPVECSMEFTDVTWPETLSDGDSGTRPTRIVIESVDFYNDVITIRNVSDESITFNEEWRLALWSVNLIDFPSVTIAPNARLKIHTTATGLNDIDDIYLGSRTYWLEPCSGEATILHNPNPTSSWYDHPAYIESFVIWGTVITIFSNGQTYNNEAVAAGAWVGGWNDVSNYVATCWSSHPDDPPECARGTPPCDTDDFGFVATGDVTQAAGFTRIATEGEVSCFRY